MSKYRKAVLALIFANIIWGIGAPIFKWSFFSIHPFTLGFFRFLIPTLILAVIVRKKFSIKPKHLVYLLLGGFFAIPINIGFFLLGIDQTLSINAPIIASSGPIFLVIGAMLFLGERPKHRVLLGDLLGLTGILLIVVEPLLEVHSRGSLTGNLLLIISMLGSVVGAILTKKITKYYDPLVITFWGFFIALLSFTPFFIQEIQQYGLASQLSFPAIGGIIWGGFFSSLIGYALYFWGLKYLPASETSVFSYIDPIAGIMVAIPLVQEYPNAFFIIGAFLVFLGVYIAEGRIHYHPFHKLFN